MGDFLEQASASLIDISSLDHSFFGRWECSLLVMVCYRVPSGAFVILLQVIILVAVFLHGKLAGSSHVPTTSQLTSRTGLLFQLFLHRNLPSGSESL